MLTADVYLSSGGDPDLNCRQNLAGIDADGFRMRIAPMTEEYGQDIHHVLQQDPDNFPYEYYSVRFSTFSGGHFACFRRYHSPIAKALNRAFFRVMQSSLMCLTIYLYQTVAKIAMRALDQLA